MSAFTYVALANMRRIVNPGITRSLIPVFATSIILVMSSLDEGAPTGGDQSVSELQRSADIGDIRCWLERPRSDIRHRLDVAPRRLPSSGGPAGGTWPAGIRTPSPRPAPASSPPALRPAVGVTDLKGGGATRRSGERKRNAGRRHGGCPAERPIRLTGMALGRAPAAPSGDTGRQGTSTERRR